jgi:predicted nuclease of predicted toxin-antitoxin system
MKKLKFLVDVNIEKPIINFLIKKGFDIKCVVDIDKKMTDYSVCEIANTEQRVLITNDKDFGEIVFFQKRISSGIILLRIKGGDASEKILLLEKLLDNHYGKIINHFVVITKEKFRFMPLEVKY